MEEAARHLRKFLVKTKKKRELDWNILPLKVAEAQSLNSSRARLDMLCFFNSILFYYLSPLVTPLTIPYYMKFSRHVYFGIWMCAYFAKLKFHDHAKILYFESLLFRIFEYNN